MTVSYNLGTDIGRIRLNIGDTDTSDPIFTDEEIQSMLTASEDDVNQATGRSLMVIANDAARTAKIKKAGNYSEDTTKVSTLLRESAKDWFERAVVPWDDVMEQTFGSVIRPYESPGEQDYIEREDLRSQ
jgi:hypothetical protein